jgi:hypothetical protein
MGDAKNYVVTWQIDVIAATPEEAAREALAIQRRQPSLATCFTVELREDVDDYGKSNVDLGWC